MALHPAATGILLAALGEASHRTQILITSHNPDLLDLFTESFSIDQAAPVPSFARLQRKTEVLSCQ